MKYAWEPFLRRSSTGLLSPLYTLLRIWQKFDFDEIQTELKRGKFYTKKISLLFRVNFIFSFALIQSLCVHTRSNSNNKKPSNLNKFTTKVCFLYWTFCVYMQGQWKNKIFITRQKIFLWNFVAIFLFVLNGNIVRESILCFLLVL